MPTMQVSPAVEEVRGYRPPKARLFTTGGPPNSGEGVGQRGGSGDRNGGGYTRPGKFVMGHPDRRPNWLLWICLALAILALGIMWWFGGLSY